LAAPGTYTSTLSKQVDGVITELSEPINFTVEQLRKGALEGTNLQDAAVFWRVYEDVIRTASAVQLTLSNALTKIKAMQKALARAKTSPGNLNTQLYQLRQDLLALDKQFNGDRSKLQVGEKTKPTIGERLFAINRSISHSTYGPTLTNRRSLKIVEEQLTDIQSELQSNIAKMSDLGKALIKAGAPWVEGDPLPPEVSHLFKKSIE